MTEKVKIPQNVADAIEKLRGLYSNYGIVIAVEKGGSDNLSESRSTLFNWTHEEDGENANKLLQALVNGYEIEPEIFYKLHEWVIYGDKIYQIYQIPALAKVNLKNGRGSVITNVPIQDIFHAAPEEIKAEKELQKWAGIEEGDVLRLIPWADKIGILIGDADDETVLVQMAESQKIWRKEKVELYAKKVGEPNAETHN